MIRSWLQRQIEKRVQQRVLREVERIQALSPGDSQVTAFRKLIQQGFPERFVWVDEFPAWLGGHRCAALEALIAEHGTSSDGLPASDILAMTECRWCGAPVTPVKPEGA